MANIKTVDLRLIEDIFGSFSGPGYVLDFGDRTFADFFRSELSIDIDHEKYRLEGKSKGKRLRAFLQVEPDALVARALRALWDYREIVDCPSKTNDEKAKQRDTRFLRVVDTMEGKTAPAKPNSGQPETGIAALSTTALGDLNGRLMALTQLQPQPRGFAFEKFLSDLFALYKLDPRRSFRNTGEQIDGSFELPPETFLLEARWQDALSNQADLLTFSGKVEGKAQWSRGLFMSYSGFSPDGLQAFALGRRTSIVCMDGLDLAHILSGSLSLVDVIQRKKRRAAETGRAFVPVRELYLSVN